ncbi:5-amino-6-(D-ribitylamino)uracil--L-tyrosine 4-hydroxyphenyl transferase CofH [Candidatus Hydrogenedentota bacterium]
MPTVEEILTRHQEGEEMPLDDAAALLQVTEPQDLDALRRAADALRESLCGHTVTYIANRNLNFTNICEGDCKFCCYHVKPGEAGGFFLSPDEVVERIGKAGEISEVCIQGGLHPDVGLEYYVELCKKVKAAFPALHIHGFSPMEIHRGAKRAGITLEGALESLRDAGLGSVPGTAAETLDDDWRATYCGNKLKTGEWIEVIITAHEVGLRTTSTILYGFNQSAEQAAVHLGILRDIQKRTGGITELVALPIVPDMVASRKALTLYAVARLFFGEWIKNIQTSWPKLGDEIAIESLDWGVNDIGGTLGEENISRLAGAPFGEFRTVEQLEDMIRLAGKTPARRNTLYGIVQPACESGQNRA